MFIAEASGNVVGFADICYAGQDVWELHLLAVHPNFRGQGIGSMLIGTIVSYVKRREGKVITLSTNTNNKRAKEFYRKFGFAETYTIQHMDLRL